MTRSVIGTVAVTVLMAAGPAPMVLDTSDDEHQIVFNSHN